MTPLRGITAPALLALLFVFGCSDDGDSPTNGNNNNNPPDTSATVLFGQQVQPLLRTGAGGFGCTATNCHGSGVVGNGLLINNAGWNDITGASGANGSLIIPSNGSGSNLYKALMGTLPGVNRMPKGGPVFMSSDQMNLIKNWIDQGAANN